MTWAAISPSCAAVWASHRPPITSPMAYTCGSFVRIRPLTLMTPRSVSAFVVSSPMSSMLAARPVATSIISARSSVGSLPSGPTSTLTPCLSVVTALGSNRASVMTVIPRFVKLRSSTLLTSASSSGTIRGAYSRTVTLDAHVREHAGEFDADGTRADDDDVLRAGWSGAGHRRS